jgi:hypothetical protein
VAWTFERTVEVKAIPEDQIADGVEAFTRFLRQDKVDSLTNSIPRYQLSTITPDRPPKSFTSSEDYPPVCVSKKQEALVPQSLLKECGRCVAQRDRGNG